VVGASGGDQVVRAVPAGPFGPAGLRRLRLAKKMPPATAAAIADAAATITVVELVPLAAFSPVPVTPDPSTVAAVLVAAPALSTTSCPWSPA